MKSLDKGRSTLRSSWEADLSVKYTEEEWNKILCNTKKMSQELKTRLVQFKTLNRVYWTPSRLYRVKLVQTPEC